MTSQKTNIGGPKNFEFSSENLEKIKTITAKYPEGKKASTSIALLYLAQEQSGGWVPKASMDKIAEILEMPPIKIYEVASFYTMFNLKPVGKYHLQICGTTPCWLRGSDKLFAICKEKLGIEHGETTGDNKFTLSEVECLGACANAPVMQINNEQYYEDLNEENFTALIEKLSKNQEVKTGSQIGRIGSEPLDETLTLKG